MSADPPQSGLDETLSIDEVSLPRPLPNAIVSSSSHEAAPGREDRDGASDGRGADTGTPGSDAGGGLVRGTLFADRYRIESMLGRGGMGAVYRVHDRLLDEAVALKTLDLGESARSDAADRFHRELRLSRKITHPNVVRTHDLGIHDGMLYITMELVLGEDLQTRLRRGPLSILEAAITAAQIAEGLGAAHATGVVHRDLKPANVLVERGGRVVVSDFGIARPFIDDGTRTMGVVGTPLYMAPEQVAGDLVDARADLYALGLLLFEMLTGRTAFSGKDALSAAVARLREPPPDPRSVAQVPTWLAELTLCCLARDPSERPPDALAIAGALRAWIAHERPAALSSPSSASRLSVAGASAPMASASGASVPSALAPSASDPRASDPRASAPEDAAANTAFAQGLTETPIPATVASSPSNPSLVSGARSASQSTPVSFSRLQNLPGSTSSPSSLSSPSSPSPSSPRPSTGQPIAPMPPADRTLAVLPLRFIGPKDQEYLGDALTDELIDVLSRTRGMRVLSSGATVRFRNDRDPHAAGTALGVDWIVDGTLQSTGQNIRVAARLIEVSTNAQLWSERFESPLEDVFDLQDKMSKRIAEALRAGITTVTYRGSAPPEAIELYLRGRRKLAALQVAGPGSAMDLLERSLAIAPEFLPAVSAHALACLRAWSLPREASDPHDWAHESRKSVERAVALAPEFAETHLAAGMLAVNDGAWREAVQAMIRAIGIAPTYAEAHQYLGQLQCEGGRPGEGIKRLELALLLDPGMSICHLDIARVAALHGDLAKFEHHIRTVFDTHLHFGALSLKTRVAIWYGDAASLRQLAVQLNELGTPTGYAVSVLAKIALGELSIQDADAALQRTFDVTSSSPRFKTLVYQMITEAIASAGGADTAIHWFTRAADMALADLEWVNRCPGIASLRDMPEFAVGRRKVLARVEAIWGS